MTEGVGVDADLLDGRYRLLGRIGSGGMGTVHRAHDERLDRDVAVKLLRSDDDPVHRARLLAEARFAGGLHHPGIVRVFDYGEAQTAAGATPYVVMQLVEGPPLSEALRERGALPPTEVAELVGQVATALTVAHAAGVVHRDLKPSNVILTTGGPVLVDFGVARSDNADPLTETGFVVGTADYISPEQAAGGRATTASDIYALGVLAHQCLTGISPFHRETPVATALAHLRDDVPELPGGVPTGLRTLLRAMLAREPEDRPGAAEVAARAAAAPATAAIVLPPMPAQPPAPPQVVSPWTRRRIAVVAGAAAVLVTALTAAAVQGGDSSAPTAAAAATRTAHDPPAASRTPTPTPTASAPATTAAPVSARPPAHHHAPPPHHGHPPKPAKHEKKPHPGKPPADGHHPKKPDGHGKHGPKH